MKLRLTAKQRDAWLRTLMARFEANRTRHPEVDWTEVEARLMASPSKMEALHRMEETGGEPDVVGRDKASGAFWFVDCSTESPAGRRSVCYDREGLESRKEHRPQTTAQDLAAEMGIELLTEAEYGALQRLGAFDTKTSSWIATPAEIRGRGGALYAERRYDRVFIGHNGAQSYYAVRGFRGGLWV